MSDQDKGPSYSELTPAGQAAEDRAHEVHDPFGDYQASEVIEAIEEEARETQELTAAFQVWNREKAEVEKQLDFTTTHGADKHASPEIRAQVKDLQDRLGVLQANEPVDPRTIPDSADDYTMPIRNARMPDGQPFYDELSPEWEELHKCGMSMAVMPTTAWMSSSS